MIAGRYDLLDDSLSGGQVRLWRRAVARITGAGPGASPSTSACCSPRPPVLHRHRADRVACDFSLGMLQAGQSRLAGHEQGHPGRLGLVAGDALRLPFRDEAFDAVTISFGLRNVADTGQALAEMRRVTRPGGRLVICEFSTIAIAPVDMLYRRYLINVLPAIARRAARNPEAYQYLAESITDWPGQRELAGLIEAAGWSAVRWRNLSLGVVAVDNVARRPRPVPRVRRPHGL